MLLTLQCQKEKTTKQIPFNQAPTCQRRVEEDHQKKLFIDLLIIRLIPKA